MGMEIPMRITMIRDNKGSTTYKVEPRIPPYTECEAFLKFTYWEEVGNTKKSRTARSIGKKN